MVDKNSYEPLYLQIQRALHDLVRQGELRPGEQIPSEHELAEQYGVSRMTIRKSLDGLVSNGVLFRQPGKGTFVAENVVHYGVSTMLSFSQTLTRQGYRVTTRVLRQEVVPGPAEVCAGLSLPPGSELLLVRRLRFVNERPVAIHTSYLDNRLFGRLRDFDLSRESLLESMERIYGIHMATSKDSVRATTASPEDSHLLGGADCLAVMEVEGVSYDERARPTRYTIATYRGDAFVLAVVNTPSQATALAVIGAGDAPNGTNET